MNNNCAHKKSGEIQSLWIWHLVLQSNQCTC